MLEKKGQATRGGGLQNEMGFSSLALAAHELKSPLALIRQLAFELESTGNSDAAIASQIRLISERSLRLSTNITKAERLQTSLFPTAPMNPLTVCEEVRRELAPLYKVSSKTLDIKSSRRATLVVANKDLLHRIIASFADNALHYSDEQGVVLLYTQLIRKKQCVRIGVRDHGPYLPKLTLKQVLSSEHHDAQHISARPESSGIGLKIAHQFADSIGGKIGAIRHQNGASFYVELPISNQLALL